MARPEMSSDNKLRQAILVELAQELPACYSLVSVDVSDGMATLTGHVPTGSDKWKAVFAGLRVTGIVSLVVRVTAEDSPAAAKRFQVRVDGQAA